MNNRDPFAGVLGTVALTIVFLLLFMNSAQNEKIDGLEVFTKKLHSRLESATFTIVAYWKDNEDKAERIAELEKLLHSMQDVIPEEHE